MGENDYCVARYTHMGNKPDTTFVEHHEWRYLTQEGVFSAAPYRVYYCIFCLKLERRLTDDGIAN